MKTSIAPFTVSALLAAASPASAQDPVKLSPQFYRVLLENEHVRVLEFRAKPGDKEELCLCGGQWVARGSNPAR
jgi:hypothetical protein